jgi:selenocysteine-specific elongation factor
MRRQELRARLGLDTRTFGAVVRNAVAAGILEETARGIWKPGSAPRLPNVQEMTVQSLLAQFARDPFNPPSVKDYIEAVGAEVYSALMEHGMLLTVSAEVVFLPETFTAMVAKVTDTLRQKGTLTFAETRDLFGSSRKYILAFLGYLDERGITRRDGEVRILVK